MLMHVKQHCDTIEHSELEEVLQIRDEKTNFFASLTVGTERSM